MMDRKLAAILAADVVGYSSQMERDEAGTFARLKAGRTELFEPEIARHHGRVFKVMGDGMLAEFGSVVCAVALQRGLAERNADVPAAERIQVRIGINLGEVIVEGDDRYGEGVNIASRLEQLAEPGGIWVSGKVAKEVEKKLAFGFESMGEQKVKNISESVNAFRLKVDGEQAKRLMPRKRMRFMQWAAALALVIVAAAAWSYLVKPQGLFIKEATATVPSVAVLPFDNLSGDQSLSYLGDGVAEDIIAMLSRFPDLSVIARNSSFTYKGKPTDVRQIGKELGVGYVLEGSVRKDADAMRIVAQLTETRDGKHVWAERFDKSGADPLVIQDEVTAKIVATLTGEYGQIRRADYQRAWGKDTANLEEYDYYLRGHAYTDRDSKEGYQHAAAIYWQGLTKFPDSKLLKTKLGFYHFFYAFNFFSDDLSADYRKAGELAREVLATHPLTPQVARLAHWLMAFVQMQEQDFAQAIAEAENAVALAPYDVTLAGNLATVLIYSGRPDQGIEWAKKWMAADPAGRPWANYRLGLAYSLKGEDERSVAALNEAHPFPDSLLLKAIGLFRLGRTEEAQTNYERALSLDPTFSQAKWREGYIYSNPAIVEGQVADLARLGLPKK
jgi:TolB-like protein/class 3 adenylate cyclase/tetratricopeptide (TPR) repeat protein